MVALNATLVTGSIHVAARILCTPAIESRSANCLSGDDTQRDRNPS